MALHGGWHADGAVAAVPYADDKTGTTATGELVQLGDDLAQVLRLLRRRFGHVTLVAVGEGEPTQPAGSQRSTPAEQTPAAPAAQSGSR